MYVGAVSYINGPIKSARTTSRGTGVDTEDLRLKPERLYV